MEILIKGAQLILSLSILVVLHELGHFLPARYFGTRVEKFYLFFDPWFSLWKKQWRGTEFGIGWIPFGGYVKISGMIDESMDKEQLSKPAEPWEFRSKPAWQRLIIMVGGVTVNLLLGMLIYIGILFTWGRDYLPLSEVKYGVHVSEVMQRQGLQDGDRILAVEGAAPRTLEEVGKTILIDGARTLTVDRMGATTTVVLPPNVQDSILASGEKTLFSPRVPFTVDTVMADGPAAGAGMRKGDKLVAVNDVTAKYYADVRKELERWKGRQAKVTVERDGAVTDLMLTVRDDGTIGIGNQVPTAYFQFAHEEFGLLAAIPAGIRYGWETLGGYVRSLKLVFSRTGASQIGGFGAIGGLFSPTWDWQVFWNMTAFLSIILAFMNILPIPALDGGHVIFLLYEMITGRAPNQRVLEVAQMIGMVLLLGLILFANGNDLFKAITR
ncbi:MAG: RIP metalloprotease RseP [Flavobacteriales bacterium]|jgi:regulator of sigma E protease|nr:RIP metalloprotease RseP [Flavobacteriales bacterium]